jgi:hypothetical protein
MEQLITKTNPAYNLPIDTVYYIESTRHLELNAYVQMHRCEIEEILHNDTPFFPYRFEYVSRNFMQTGELFKWLKLKYPDKPVREIRNLKNQIMQYSQTDLTMGIDGSFRDISFLCRTIPFNGNDEGYRFVAVDYTDSSCEELLPNLSLFLQHVDHYSQCCESDGDIIQESHSFFSLPQSSRIFSKHMAKSVSDEEVCSFMEEKPVLNLRATALKIRNEIAQMQRSSGINILIEVLGDDLLQTLNKLQPSVLGRLVVDGTMSIHLPDYQNREVKLTALPKALYFLFLLHPDGIRLKDLSDHASLLLEIYKLVSNRESIESMKQSVNDLVDPLSNSVNEKLSRIRKAFYDLMSSDLAQHYIPDGARGEAKKIILDRNLIQLPSQLLQLLS